MTTRILKKLEKELGYPVVVLAASWREDIAYNFEEQAAQRFIDALESLGGAPMPKIGLVLFFRGGTVGFADWIVRVTKSRSEKFVALIPTLVHGASSLIALAADEVVFHPYGALGACDAAPLLTGYKLTADVYDDVPALGGLQYDHDLEMPARVAHQMSHKRRVQGWVKQRQDIDSDAFSVVTLGRDTGLSASQCKEAGLNASVSESDALDKMRVDLENELGVRGKELVLYRESDLSNEEVEFEAAFGVTAAIVESRRKRHVFERDTGRPDPDTGELLGEWSY